MSANRVRTGEKAPDLAESALNAVGGKTVNRPESVYTANARAEYIKRQDDATRKELVDLSNPFKNRQYTSEEIVSRRKDLMKEIADRNKTINK